MKIAANAVQQALATTQALQTAQAHHQAGRLREAEGIYRQILAQQPNHAHALQLLGVLAAQVGRADAGIELIRRAITYAPSIPEFHNSLGEVLQSKGNLDEAIAAFRRAIQLKPDFVIAYHKLGLALIADGQLKESLAAFEQAVALKPDDPSFASYRVFLLHFHPDYTAQAIFEAHQQWNQQHAASFRSHIRPHTNDRSPERRLKVGYVSLDLREHPVGYNMLPLFREHDHQRFEVFAYSNVLGQSAMTQEFHSYTDKWRDIVGLSDEQMTDLIRKDGIDILVDLALHTANNRLLVFARQPAPVQVSFAGYPGSTGLETIGYRLTDPYLEPPGLPDASGSEEAIHLPDSFWCYAGMATDIPVNPLPAASAGYVTFGCLNQYGKVNELVLGLWAKVLREVTSSRLLLLAPPGRAREQALATLGREGVEPFRVEFTDLVPRLNYLQGYNRIDIGLDTLPYNGHTTSLDALWMGVPVVSLVGETVVGRAGLSQLSNLGLTELVAQTPEEYVQIAARLAEDVDRLALLRSSLRERMRCSPLMDAPRFARGVEAAYRQMWYNWCKQSMES